jgi:hypothetical protein
MDLTEITLDEYLKYNTIDVANLDSAAIFMLKSMRQQCQMDIAQAEQDARDGLESQGTGDLHRKLHPVRCACAPVLDDRESIMAVLVAQDPDVVKYRRVLTELEAEAEADRKFAARMNALIEWEVKELQELASVARDRPVVLAEAVSSMRKSIQEADQASAQALDVRHMMGHGMDIRDAARRMFLDALLHVARRPGAATFIAAVRGCYGSLPRNPMAFDVSELDVLDIRNA